MRTPCRARGFSLVEAVVVITVVSLAAPPLTALLCQTLRDGAQSNMETQALALAKGMMEEILSKGFEDPQSASGSFGTEEGSRAGYDDVDDYDGYSQSPPTDCRGAAFSAYAAFRVQAAVQNVNADAPGGAAVAHGSTDYKRVTVTVSWQNGGRVLQLVGLATRRDDKSRPPVVLTFLSRRTDWNDDDLIFRVRNDSDHGVYITSIIATWASPSAWYEYITVNAMGYIDYGTVWDYSSANYVRMESGGNAMFNRGDVVYVPAGTTAEIALLNFMSSRTSIWPSMRNIHSTQFSVEIWAGPDHCTPITIPSF